MTPFHPIKHLVALIEQFERDWAHQYAGAAVEIDSQIEANPGENVEPTGINVVFRPAHGYPESGVFIVGPHVDRMLLKDAPAELMIRGIATLPRLGIELKRRAYAINVMATQVADQVAEEWVCQNET